MWRDRDGRRRKIKMVLLGLGALGGFASGFASLSCHRARWHHRRSHFQERVTQVCTDAVARAQQRSAVKGRP